MRGSATISFDFSTRLTALPLIRSNAWFGPQALQSMNATRQDCKQRDDASAD